jgi:hypothetical protein
MKDEARKQVKELIVNMINDKLEKYSPETVNMPFFQAIFSKEEVFTASIIQSFYTSFGMSVYEQMAIILAKNAGYEMTRQYKLLGKIDPKTESLITEMHKQLREGSGWDSTDLTGTIRASIKPGSAAKDPDSTVDLFMKKGQEEYYFGITTVKPNKEGFSTHARKMLRWIALRLSQDKNTRIHVGVVIPYNPYDPEPYDRWECQTMFGSQLYVGKDFWNFVAGEDVYKELLGIFKEVGKETRPKIRAILENGGNK